MTDEFTSAPTASDWLSGLSDQQEIVRMVLNSCSGLLSVIGSSIIVLKILRGFRSMTTYDRMVLGMSICDIISSIKMAIDDILVPSDTQELWALGNEATCQAAAFSHASIFWGLYYNAMLSLYFLLMVLSQLRKKEYVRKSELWMHLVGLWFPITATIGLFLGWFGLTKHGICSIQNMSIWDIVWGYPRFFSFLLIFIDYCLICAIVRKSLNVQNESQKRLKRETTTLMILYVASLFVVWGPYYVRQILNLLPNGYTASQIYPLMILEATTYPLQGFLSAFIYFKPAYTRFRAANPNKPIRFVLHQALFNRTAPRKSNYHHRNGQHVTHGSAYGHKITDISFTDRSATNAISFTDRSASKAISFTDRSASNAVEEDDVGVGITGIDFQSSIFFVEEDAANDSPLEGVAEENDDAPESNP